MEKKFEMTFELVCEYAKEAFPPRTDLSKAKDYTKTYWDLPYSGRRVMALYEGEKRTLRGHDKPEVCWICVDEYAGVFSVPSRYIRQADMVCGFGFNPSGRQRLIDYFYDKQKEVNSL